MSDLKYEVGGSIQDAKGEWHEIKSISSDCLHIKGLKYVIMPQFIRNYCPPSRTVRQWLETLPAGIRERALRNAKPNNTKGTASSLDSALCYAFAFGHSPEGGEFWWKVLDALRDSTPFPDPPDLGYGTDRLTGEPIEAPEGMEIVPEGERCRPGDSVYTDQWLIGSVTGHYIAGLNYKARAYARPIRQRRKAKPPELWRIGETGAIVMALEKTRGANITDNCLFYSSEGFGEHKGDTFIARSLEEYYRDGYVHIEDVRRELSAGERITVNIGGESEMEVVRRERIDDILDKLGIKEGKQ